MNRHLKFTIIVLACFLFTESNAQAPRFIFLDSLSYNLSPVSAVVIKAQGYKRTESVTIAGTNKLKDTLYRNTFFYNEKGQTTSSLQHNQKRLDTLAIHFVYDSLNRLVERTGSVKGRRLFFTISQYDHDSLIILDFNYKSILTSRKKMLFDDHLQLLEFFMYDSSGKQTTHTTYTYDQNLLPQRVIQTTGSRTDFDNLYEHDLGRKGRTVSIYEMFAGYKRLIEKIHYNNKGQLVKTTSYDYYYRNKKFIAEFEYYDDGSLRSYKAVYPYSGYTTRQYYYHYRN